MKKIVTRLRQGPELLFRGEQRSSFRTAASMCAGKQKTPTLLALRYAFHHEPLAESLQPTLRGKASSRLNKKLRNKGVGQDENVLSYNGCII